MTEVLDRTDGHVGEEPVRHMLSIPDPSGDLRVMWDPRNTDETKAAREAFHKAKKKGMLAYAVDEKSGEKGGEVIHEFDPERGKIIMTKPLAGG
jgi:hypothetical protein